VYQVVYDFEMPQRNTALQTVQWISIARLIASLLFAALAFQQVPLGLLACLYALAMTSDLIDGFLARRLKAESYAGRILDLISDKSLTIVSLLYAAQRGISLLALSFIASREVVVLGLRAIIVNGKQLLPTNRLFGGIMAVALWGNTLLLVHTVDGAKVIHFIGWVYWGCAVIFCANLAHRVYVSWQRITDSLSSAERPEINVRKPG
jgi:phosphatidylglycerophosphate synthase